MARILPLEPEAITQLHSSKHITTLQGVVLALLENSLDAGSTKVGISTDFRRGSCEVEDNGPGIPSVEFSEQGAIGKMYHTSKRGQIDTDRELYGTSGTFLASLAALCLLSITSKHITDHSTASMTIHQSRVISRRLNATSARESTYGPPQGTRVIVRDLFGNMPVRVKQRAIAADDTSRDEKAWAELKYGIVALLLAWNRPCSVSLECDSGNRRTLQFSAGHQNTKDMLTKRSLDNLGKPNLTYDIRDTLPILVHGGFASLEDRASWVPISASTSKVSVTGVINLQPAPTKQCQFISIGIHPCRPDGPLNDLYDSINMTFANSSFGYTEEIASSNLENTKKDRQSRDRRYKSDGYTKKQLQRRKGVDRWPMFVLQISFKRSHGVRWSAMDTNTAMLKTAIDVLEIAVMRWLEAHHFRPHTQKQRRNGEQQAPSASLNVTNSPELRSPLLENEDRDIRTPTVPTNSTVVAASTSKKRKFVDMTGISHYLETRPASMPAQVGPFATWSRIKSGRGSFHDEILKQQLPRNMATQQQSPIPKEASVITRIGFDLPPIEAGAFSRDNHAKAASRDANITEPHPSSSSRDFGSIDDEAMATLDDPQEQISDPEVDSRPNDDDRIHWTDPVTKEVLAVNARTGVVLSTKHQDETNVSPGIASENCSNKQPATINATMNSTEQQLTLTHRLKRSREDEKWLPGFLKDWDNPIFTPQHEEMVPTASFDYPGIDMTEVTGKRRSHGEHCNVFAANITKTELKSAKVLSQVDRKFILCKVGVGTNSVDGQRLLLVDQHAASERVILEQLLANICRHKSVFESGNMERASSAKVSFLQQPLRFVVPDTESELLGSRVEYFANWNILYDLNVRHEPESQSKVRGSKREHLLLVKGLPSAIAERGVQYPNLIIELIRSEIHRNRFTSRISGADGNEDDEHTWLSRIGSCPQGLLDMLNSRACRSAIMFNDELSNAQCEELLRALSECVFPFTCAHGRVSMVPLVEIGSGGIRTMGGMESSGYQDNPESVNVYKTWLEEIKNRPQQT